MKEDDWDPDQPLVTWRRRISTFVATRGGFLAIFLVAAFLLPVYLFKSGSPELVVAVLYWPYVVATPLVALSSVTLAVLRGFRHTQPLASAVVQIGLSLLAICVWCWSLQARVVELS